MKTFTFANGDTIPLMGLGTWQSAPGEVGEAVKTAIKLGYRLIDCAAIYGNEAEIGKALAECFAEGIVKREELFITSKLWNDSHALDDVLPALQKTLLNLKIEYVDLYLMHWPVAVKKEVGFPTSGKQLLPLSDVPISETWGQMEIAVDRGLVRHIGVSNFSSKKIEELLKTARIPLEVNQVERHPYLQQLKLVDFCNKNKILVQNFSPLGSNDRPEQMKLFDEPILMKDPLVLEIAERHNITPAQVLLKWAIDSGSSAIPKSTNPSRLTQNLVSVNVDLDKKDFRKLKKIDRHRRYFDGSFWCMEGSPYTLANMWDE